MAALKAGRVSPSDVTIYKSLGSIVQDLASGWFIFGQAREANPGSRVSF